MSLEYHLRELLIVMTPGHPKRSVPQLRADELRVLDVGCGIGQTLIAEEFDQAKELHGVDIDAEAIKYGQYAFRRLNLQVGCAELLPYHDSTFDFVFSRVALPYTNMPKAVREIHRVLRPGGRAWVTLHTWDIERERLRNLSVKRVIDSVYVIANSLLVNRFGVSISRPWNGQHESFQTSQGALRVFQAAGLDPMSIWHRYPGEVATLRIEAVKPEAPAFKSEGIL